MMRVILYCVATLAAVFPACVTGETNAPFTTAPLVDAELARVSGTSASFAPLSRGILLKLVDTQGRTDFRQSSLISQNQMDVWWGTIGSELIANAVRAQLSGLEGPTRL